MQCVRTIDCRERLRVHSTNRCERRKVKRSEIKETRSKVSEVPNNEARVISAEETRERALVQNLYAKRIYRRAIIANVYVRFFPVAISLEE